MLNLSGSVKTVTCSLHGSMFRLADGRVMRGPAITRLPIHEVRVVDDQVEVRLAAGRR